LSRAIMTKKKKRKKITDGEMIGVLLIKKMMQT
jgi:hypothetical protein